MSFTTALTGLRATQKDLEVVSNNIANASTAGFKRSRAEFGDLYPVGGGSATAGSGVQMQAITQQFSQGTVNATNNPLDLAISGEGFFVTRTGDQLGYTRAGAFQVDDQGQLVSANGANVMGYLPDGNGGVNAELNPLVISDAALAPQATTRVKTELNLDSEVDSISLTFDPTDQESFNYLSTSSLYDAQGQDYTLQQYYVKDADNSWRMYPYVDGQAMLTGGAFINVDFNAQGQLSNVAPSVTGAGAVDNVNPSRIDLTVPAGLTNGSGAVPFTLDLGQTTQFGSSFAINDLEQDGFSAGRLGSVEITDTGDIMGRYSNGSTAIMGRVAVANFANVQGLIPAGSTAWLESIDSGQALIGQPGTGQLGLVRSSALESSNVDTTEELVALINAQRNYQANAKVIETSETIAQAILNAT